MGVKIRSEEYLDLLISSAQESGLTVDLLEFVSRGLDDKAVAILFDNVSKLPQYMKSRDIPYLRRSFIAPSTDTRKSPLSH